MGSYHVRKSDMGGSSTIEETEPGRGDDGGGDGDAARTKTAARLRKIEETLRFRVGLEALVTGLSTRLLGVHLDELPAVVEEGLGKLCGYFGVDRAYALKVDKGIIFDLNVEWWAEGIPRVTTPVADLPIEAIGIRTSVAPNSTSEYRKICRRVSSSPRTTGSIGTPAAA